MPLIRWTDPDFRVCRISFNTLLEIQLEAEKRGWATRWSSVDALRSQVGEADMLLQSLMREERGGDVHAYRCLVLFSTPGGRDAGGIAAVDVDPDRFEALERLDRDLEVRDAFIRVFSLAQGGISMISKK
ncbi:hypothetical protein [Streptomyces hoynatensis]|uniref:Uncharacterized protein n=1 Tax=Streptomyces hoynatensis TaxID=1141874 RepID=A0A3A9YTH1_9ACTN|nr:hypothetical protein [Streptomyces hoynatensis]RKN39260.1 hypothetical protein D7294_22075 [Streptomyces hoynatensis]